VTDERDSRRFRASFPDVTDPGFRTAAWRVGVPKAGESLKVLHPTLLHALKSAARLGESSGITLLSDQEDGPSETRSFKRIYADVRVLADVLAARGVRRGDRVLVVLPTSFEFIATLFALQRLGAIPVPTYPPAALEKLETGLDRLAHIGNHSEAAWCITNRTLRKVIGELAFRVKSLRRIMAADKMLEGPDKGAAAENRPSVPPPFEPSPKDPALIQYTSGSTGSPKGVLLTHANIIANVHAAGLASQVNRKDSVASWLPLYHDMGLVGGVLFPIYWRLNLVLMSPMAFLFRPVRWLRAISERRVTITSSPNFGYALCVKRVRPSEREGLDLSSWRISLNGAEPVNMKTVGEFVAAFGPYGYSPATMFPAYGLAESTVAVTFPTPGEPVHAESVDRAALADGHVVPSKEAGAVVVASVGKAVPGHQIVVADESGEELVDRQVGHILVRGPSVMSGYYRDLEATAKVLRGGWLWTGDLGFTIDGRLYVTGRVKDLIIVRGHNYYAEDVERVAEGVGGLRHGGVAAFAVYDEEQARDLAVAVCETRAQNEDEEKAMAEKVIEAVAEATGLTLDEVVFVEPGTIPKTSSGKRQRSLTRERYLKDELVRERTGRLQIANVFVRSAVGLLALLGRDSRRRREPP
jgi:acyl-CoA synthetase (AMP-forming)/AMP-acid ligase II